MTESPPAGRRARTRERLLAAALELFARKGFDDTTVAEIAAAAGVTPMTFFRHFGSKEAVVLDDPYDPLMVAGVAAQPFGLPPLVRAVRGVRTAWERVPVAAAAPVRERVRIAAASPGLRAAMVASTERSQEAVAGRLVEDGADPVAAAVAASAVLSALMTALVLWAQREDDDLGAAILGALDVLDVPAGRAGTARRR